MDFTEAYDDTSTSVGMAARVGNAVLLQELLQQGSPTNGHDNRGWRPLHEAADGGHVECVRLLLPCDDAEVDALTHEGTTALQLACRSGSEYADIVKLLLSAGADPDMKAGDDWVLPLPKAVANNSIHIAELLLDAGADPNRKDYHYGLPLHVAAEKGLLEVAQLLIKRGSEFNWADDAGRTVLHALLFPPLVRDTLIPLMNLFIDRGCDVNARMTDGTTPLMLAVQCNAKEAVLRLLDCGADPNIIKANGIVALHYAVEFCPDSEFTDESDMEDQQENPSILGRILDLTSRDLIIPQSLKPIKYTIFHLAIEWDRFNTLKVLIRKGIPPDAFLQETANAVLDEADVNLFLQLPLVMSLGTEVDTPLGFLLSKPVSEKRAAVAKFMIDKGSNCNPVTPNCLPPLVAAVKHQRATYDQDCPSLEVVEYLLKNGADILHKLKNSDVLPAALHISSLFNVSAFFTLLQWGCPAHEVYTKEALEKLRQTYASSRYYAIYPLFPWRVISWLNVLNMFVPQLPLDTKEIFDIGRMVDDEHLTTAWNNLNNLIESPKDLQSLCVLAVRRAIGERRGWSNLSSRIAKLQFANAPLPQIIMERLVFKQIQKAHLFQCPPLSVMPNYCLPESLGDESGEDSLESEDEGLESEDENEEENLDSPQSSLSHSELEDGLAADEVVDSDEGNVNNPGADKSIDDRGEDEEEEEGSSESRMSDDENLARLSCDSGGSGKDNLSNSGTKRKRP
ncbi:LOW QUALITY PROTEIN: ankyrin repeat and SOCS box protein 14-like [Macrobrachium rosenbergii]|uniref:LOW QUALITY PROTEIN: ankyrin repeat and SOCS box protein 14-like n=1 Tax=Macrobrachium rosenbergii TaxID=79674 RepID=UPI0034D6CC2C